MTPALSSTINSAFFLSLLLVTSAAIANEPTTKASSFHTSSTIGFEMISDTTTAGQTASDKFFPISFSVESERYAFEISMPYIERSAPSGAILKDHHHKESRTNQTTATPIVTNQGFGDLTTSLQHFILNEKTAVINLSAKAEMKLATADTAKGLGTGVNDYFLEMQASKSFGNWMAKTSLGYGILGNPSSIKVNDDDENDANNTVALNLKNILYGSLGASYAISDVWKADINFDYGQASEVGGSEQQDLSAAIKYQISPHNLLQLSAFKSMVPSLSVTGASVYLVHHY
jgi:hypothetical protein